MVPRRWSEMPPKIARCSACSETRRSCSSTKGFAGHTLGASGAVEAVFCALAIQHGFLPGSPHTLNVDPAFKSQFLCEGRSGRIDRAMSNSFGFGGANCSLLLGRAK